MLGRFGLEPQRFRKFLDHSSSELDPSSPELGHSGKFLKRCNSELERWRKLLGFPASAVYATHPKRFGFSVNRLKRL
jgi:hypothetical protein